jgi:hypothetical protein
MSNDFSWKKKIFHEEIVIQMIFHEENNPN